MPKAVVIAPGYADHTIERAALAPLGVELEICEWGEDRALLHEGLAQAEVIFVRDTALDRAAIAACRTAKGIVRYGVGVDRVDLEEASRRSIKVANIPHYGADVDVADHTLALYLAVQRRIVTRDRQVRDGIWGVGQAEPVDRISGKILGLIGYGRIARGVHRRFAAFGITEVLVCDPYLAVEEARSAGVTPVSLSELAASSDIISLHAPADGIRPTIDAALLSTMRPGTILLNTARGSHIDEGALVDALSHGRLRGAGLDVLASEPPLTNNPLLALPNIVLSDHAAWYSDQSVERLQTLAAEEAVHILKGQPPVNWVNPW